MGGSADLGVVRWGKGVDVLVLLRIAKEGVGVGGDLDALFVDGQ